MDYSWAQLPNRHHSVNFCLKLCAERQMAASKQTLMWLMCVSELNKFVSFFCCGIQNVGLCGMSAVPCCFALCAVFTALCGSHSSAVSPHFNPSVSLILKNTISCFYYVVLDVVRRLIYSPIRTDRLFSCRHLLLYSSHSFTLSSLWLSHRLFTSHTRLEYCWFVIWLMFGYIRAVLIMCENLCL